MGQPKRWSNVVGPQERLTPNDRFCRPVLSGYWHRFLPADMTPTPKAQYPIAALGGLPALSSSQFAPSVRNSNQNFYRKNNGLQPQYHGVNDADGVNNVQRHPSPKSNAWLSQ